MQRTRFAAAAAALALVTTLPARADTTAQALPFSQDWTNAGLITTSDNWSGVPGVIGYRGDGLTSTTGTNPTTITADGATTPVDVNANVTSVTFTTGGVTEFQIANPVVAIAGSGTANAPHLVFTISTTGQSAIVFACNLRDLETVDSAIQPIAIQYRVGTSGAYTNVPGGYFADVTAAAATPTTAVSLTLPSAADNQAIVQIRVLTTDALGNDEWVGIDDISITGTPASVCGNRALEGDEACDDGNLSDGDCCSSRCQFESVSTLCRAARDFDCDEAEYCTGASGVCPADVRAVDGTPCGTTGPLACDAQDRCAAGLCAVLVAPAGTACRASTGVCDPAEACTGTSASCPADVFAAAGTTCRPAVDVCDVTEQCSGRDAGCPADTFSGVGTLCRAAAGSCDSAELCSGTSPSCPGDSVLPLGTPCRPSTGACDPAESCAGFAACPPDRTAADGTACSDGTACNGAETCAMGTCRAGSPLSCDDGNACTADACAEPSGCESTPIRGCCNVDRDCPDDGNACTAERCSGTGGSCERLPVAGCCNVDADCTGGSVCTRVSCNRATNRCESAPVPGCCASDADCSDGAACTADRCDRGTGVCTNRPIAGCCAGDGDCDDRDPCSVDRCAPEAGGAGRCTASPIAGCCVADSDCTDADGSACTTPRCNTTTDRCTETLVRCDDADDCTADTCEADGSCSHVPLTCDDRDDCTADSCASGACEHAPIAGCGAMADAGVPDTDAGLAPEDAALPDAGFTNDAALTRLDAAVDTGPLDRLDTGLGTADAGPLDLRDTSGCDRCAATPDRSARGLWTALFVLGLALARVRRRARAARLA